MSKQMTTREEKFIGKWDKMTSRIGLGFLYFIGILGALTTLIGFGDVLEFGTGEEKLRAYLVSDAPDIAGAMLALGTIAAFAGFIWAMLFTFRLTNRAAKKIKTSHEGQYAWKVVSIFVSWLPILLVITWMQLMGMIDTYFIIGMPIIIVITLVIMRLTPWGKRFRTEKVEENLG